MPSLSLSHRSKEQKYSASQWIKHQLLVDVQEMDQLLHYLAPFTIYNVTTLAPFADLEITKGDFLRSYQQYIEGMRIGKISAHLHFSCGLGTDPEAVYAELIDTQRYMVKLRSPLIQMQPHRFLPSKEDSLFHSMVMSPNSISWGIQFSYPQIVQVGNQLTKNFIRYPSPNTLLFTRLSQWIRKYSIPTTYLWQGRKIATSFRTGRSCCSWINHCPQLQEQGIVVHVY